MVLAQRFLRSLFLCFALLLIVCLADEVRKDDKVKTIRASDVSTRMLSRSGKIMMVRDDDDDDDDDNDNDDDNDDDTGDNDDDANDNEDNDDDDEDFSDSNEELLSFEVEKIEEKDADGMDVGKLEKHFVDSLDDVKFTFSPVDSQSSLQGLPVINVNMSAFLVEQMATLDLIVYLFRRGGSVTFGTETFAVQSGTVKFNIKISDWDFCDGTPADCSEGKSGEFLDLKLKIKSKGLPAEVDDEDRKKAAKPAICKDNDNDDTDDQNDSSDNDDDCPFIFDVGGDSEMLLNQGVVTDDDKYTAMPLGFPKFEFEDGEKKFVFRIPKFNQNVLIDPSVNVGRIKSAASWSQLNTGLALLLYIITSLHFFLFNNL